MIIYFDIEFGGMAEWSKAAVLKTVECNSSVGSNPTPSASFETFEKCSVLSKVKDNSAG